jgi:protein-arginine kinase activator protein McsA
MARRATFRGKRHHRNPRFSLSVGAYLPMVKPEWGTKRTCPKCGTRFYDLGKDNPVSCVECGAAWEPDPILKSKQPLRRAQEGR